MSIRIPEKGSAPVSFFPQPQDPTDTFYFERYLSRIGFDHVAGVDEAGRGPLAGPVVAGCVTLSSSCPFHLFVDSKKLSAAKRDMLYTTLYKSEAAIGVGVVEAAEIDSMNILQASLEAMRRAVLDLRKKKESKGPDFLLVDGTFQVPMDLQQQALIKGESKSASIAAASIIAKVTRDGLMEEYDHTYPQYGFGKHKGYPTKAHRRAVAEYGPCPIHRRSFKGVREYCLASQDSRVQRSLW